MGSWEGECSPWSEMKSVTVIIILAGVDGQTLEVHQPTAGDIGYRRGRRD